MMCEQDICVLTSGERAEGCKQRGSGAEVTSGKGGNGAEIGESGKRGGGKNEEGSAGEGDIEREQRRELKN